MADIAFSKYYPRALLDEFRVNLEVSPDHLPYGHPHLRNRSVGRIFVIRQIPLASLGAQPAMNTGVHHRLDSCNTSAYDRLDRLFYLLRSEPFYRFIKSYVRNGFSDIFLIIPAYNFFLLSILLDS